MDWINPYKISLGEGLRERVKVDRRIGVSSIFTRTVRSIANYYFGLGGKINGRVAHCVTINMKWELLRQVTLLDLDQLTARVVDVLLQWVPQGEHCGSWVLNTIAPQIETMPAETIVVESQGWILGAGLVDLYSHSGEPGFESRETLESLAQAAYAGGFSRVHLLPRTVPALDQAALIRQIHNQSDRFFAQIPVRLSCWGALSLHCQGKQMTEFAELAAADCVGFTDDAPIQDWVLLRRSLEYLQPLQKPIAVWPCHRSFHGSGMSREGTIALQLGIPALSPLSETLALAGIIECVAATGTPVHLLRISTARGVDLIAQAKAQGLPITASTTWMHLLCHTGDLQTYNTALRLDPPLGNPTDQAALLQGLEQGILDAIAVDHSPYTYEEKQVGFDGAPPGAIGLELVLPLLWQALVETGRWTAAQLWYKLSQAPAHCLHQTLPPLEPGSPVELTLFNPRQTWVVDAQTLQSRSSNTYWLGQEIQGRVVKGYRSAKPYSLVTNGSMEGYNDWMKRS